MICTPGERNSARTSQFRHAPLIHARAGHPEPRPTAGWAAPQPPGSRVRELGCQPPSLRLLPIDLPDYSGIGSIKSENVVRSRLHSKLHPKRNGAVVSLPDWGVYADRRISGSTARLNWRGRWAGGSKRVGSILLNARGRLVFGLWIGQCAAESPIAA
jgi:hypothetical protein